MATDGATGAWLAGLWTVAVALAVAVAVAVADAGGASEDGEATRGACVSTLVTGGFTAVVGDTGATATGAVVTCVTGGAGGSTTCCV